ncbi:hypothetical protein CC86DRAFT_408790 [Ophiobolus disseminans]|uniref:DUF7580 domain-containing protein n=1 Tax=Ophiobolus disseminans TaxID=1469910 RepID=A0A6A6ZSL0_9PLEO|nr:hypothetical protein CC86DRAFT_408790 [Ophiobolus disseminans]
MSGVEVAGLVLGCLPLIIQGIESYNEGLDPIKSFARWRSELPQVIRKLRNQHVHYAQTIRILFEPITSDIELAEMMANPGSAELWKGTVMAGKLQERLQESYQAYQGTIMDIERITKKIASKLDLERATELSRNDLEALLAANPKKGNDKFEIGKRIRFGMNKKAVKALLEELDDCNKELERFTDKSEKIETFRKSVKPAFATRLQRIQSYAKSLHGSLLWSCACSASHKTSLQLEPRGNLFASGMRKTLDTKTCFTVSFTTISATDDAPWRWRAAEIQVEDEDWSLTPISSPKPRMSKSVSFSAPPPYSVADPGAELTLSPSSSLQEVKDLCASIKQMHASRLGFSLDSKNKLHGAYSVDASETCVSCAEVVTLEDLLDHPPVVNGRRAKLSKKERYNLALTLASSVLYLNATPWLNDQWAAKDILFHRTTTSTRPIDIDHPYVAQSLLELAKGLPNGQNARGFHNKNTVLLALAIALLELYFGTTAEKYQNELGTSDPSLHQNPWLLCHMVHTWAEEAQEDLSAAFLTAVRHCLRCFSDPGASLQDSEFLQAAVEGIVLPLQEELHQFLGTTVT